MFTGIITDVVTIVSSQSKDNGLELVFERPAGWSDLTLGESINTNGVCLTVTAMDDTTYTCFLMPETLNKTSFGTKVPPRVNLERALSVHDRFGGHFVQGHVDGIGTVLNVQQDDDYVIQIGFAADNQSLVIYKGSITLNGVSLTVSEVGKGTLTVAVIPHTLEHTTLGSLNTGDTVNLEFDVLGKYVANHLQEGQHAAS